MMKRTADMEARLRSITTRKPKPKRKAPSTREMKAVVRAWLAKHHPDEEYVELNACDHRGCGTVLLEVLGPPRGKKWDAVR